MAIVFVEARPKGKPEHSPIEDYIVEDHADHPLATFPTQAAAVKWAKEHGHIRVGLPREIQLRTRPLRF